MKSVFLLQVQHICGCYNFYFILFYFILFYFILFYFILFCFVLFYAWENVFLMFTFYLQYFYRIFYLDLNLIFVNSLYL